MPVHPQKIQPGVQCGHGDLVPGTSRLEVQGLRDPGFEDGAVEPRGAGEVINAGMAEFPDQVLGQDGCEKKPDGALLFPDIPSSAQHFHHFFGVAHAAAEGILNRAEELRERMMYGAIPEARSAFGPSLEISAADLDHLGAGRPHPGMVCKIVSQAHFECLPC